MTIHFNEIAFSSLNPYIVWLQRCFCITQSRVDTRFQRRAFEIQTAKGVSGGILPQKSVKTEVLGNGLSSILRPSQHVIVPLFF